jgi:hypothetical protein
MYIRKRQFNRSVRACASGCSRNWESMLQGCFSLWHTLRAYKVPACWLPPERVRVYMFSERGEWRGNFPWQTFFGRAHKWKRRAGKIRSSFVCTTRWQILVAVAACLIKVINFAGKKGLEQPTQINCFCSIFTAVWCRETIRRGDVNSCFCTLLLLFFRRAERVFCLAFVTGVC